MFATCLQIVLKLTIYLAQAVIFRQQSPQLNASFLDLARPHFQYILGLLDCFAQIIVLHHFRLGGSLIVHGLTAILIGICSSGSIGGLPIGEICLCLIYEIVQLCQIVDDSLDDVIELVVLVFEIFDLFFE